MSWWEVCIVAVFAVLPILIAGDTCLSPSVKPKVYTTTDASVAVNTVIVIEFSVTCKNGIKDLNLYAELNGHAIPASKIKDSNSFQVSFSSLHKDTPAGNYEVRFFDEEGYSALRKAQRSGDNAKSVASLFAVPVTHPGASHGILVQTEFVAAVVATLVWYIAHSARGKLQSNNH
ncbi:hypothetical protein LSH36_52g09047 [Paralvinella palmiformis]|uniref:Translocon-associated protein subunit delta n=1 Tax=Paralvinella palmiformis TaxID=53620 RepID=A0AAD9K7A2_9ANNE|nr:hypothetical protein LSH36_52g09047 [Paralvinella palmiformis]